MSGATLGLDLGSCYVKAVVLDDEGRLTFSGVAPTQYDYGVAIDTATGDLTERPTTIGATGYGRQETPSSISKTEISCLARGLIHHGVDNATLIDIGGQDSKVLAIANGRLQSHVLNRRCAAGTGAYLEFIAFRLGLDISEMSSLARQSTKLHQLNSFCTVFTSTEILDCLRRKVPLVDLVRGMFASIAERVREMAPLIEPIYLSGGVIAHHPVFLEVLSEAIEAEVLSAPHPQLLAATGAALYAREAA